jgi:hypothetical protein
MTTLREAAQQAEAVLRGCLEHPDAADAITAIRAALAEPDEPIAWAMPRPDGLILDVICPEEHARMPGQYTVPLYTQPKAEQEPVAYMHCPSVAMDGKIRPVLSFEKYEDDYASGIYAERIPLYAAPQPRKRLDVHEILDLMPEGVPARYDGELIAFCRAIEAAVWGETK